MFSLILLCLWWCIAAVATFIMMVFTRATCWLWAALTIKREDFPWYLAWLGQYDDNLDGNRDEGWRKEHILTPDTGLRKWWNRTRWIFRNPSQYFDYHIAGQVIKPGWDDNAVHIPFIHVKGDSAVSDCPLREGWFLKLLSTGDRYIPFFRWVWKWPSINRCIDIKLGWAVWTTGDRAKLVFTIDPLSKTIKDGK